MNPRKPDTAAPGSACPAPRQAELHEMTCDGDPDAPAEPIGADGGRDLWLAATLADELRITSGPDSIIVSLYMRLD